MLQHYDLDNTYGVYALTVFSDCIVMQKLVNRSKTK